MGVISIGAATLAALERVSGAAHAGNNGSTGAIHPDSLLAGSFEDDFFYQYAKGDADRLYQSAAELLKRKNALRRLARAEKRDLTDDEHLATLITNTGLRVFEQLTNLARTCAGKVFPTWEWIEAASGVSRASVGRALTALATMGLIDKRSRWTYQAAKSKTSRPTRKQTSNVYRMKFPKVLERFLPLRLRTTPIAVDQAEHHRRQAEQIERMRRSRTLRQFMTEEIVDNELRELLDRLAISDDRCESQKDGQQIHRFIY